MFRFKQLLLFVVASILCLGFSVNVLADENVSDFSLIADEKVSCESQLAENAFFDIKNQIIDDYGKLYRLENFSYDYILREEIDKNILILMCM